MKACMKSNWYIVARFCIASARKHFSRRTEVVGDQLCMISLICMSPLTHILALSLSEPPYELSLALKAHFTGIISSAGRALSDVSFSNRPNISFLIASPHFSLMIIDNLKTCERDLGSFPWFYLFGFVHGLYSCIPHYLYLQDSFSLW